MNNNQLVGLDSVMLTELKLELTLSNMQRVMQYLQMHSNPLFFCSPLHGSKDKNPEVLHDMELDEAQVMLDCKSTFFGSQVIKQAEAKVSSVKESSGVLGLWLNTFNINGEAYYSCDETGQWGSPAFIPYSQLSIQSTFVKVLEKQVRGSGINNKRLKRFAIIREYFSTKRKEHGLPESSSYQDIYESIGCPSVNQIWNEWSALDSKYFPANNHKPKFMTEVRREFNLSFKGHKKIKF